MKKTIYNLELHEDLILDNHKSELNKLSLTRVSECGCGGVMEETLDGLSCTICG